MSRPFKDIDEKLLVQRYLDGATSRELAREFNLCKQTVLNRVSKYVDISVSVEVKKVVRKSF